MRDFLVSTVLRAGEIAMTWLNKSTKSIKPDGSFVTEADKAVEEFLKSAIATEYPGSSFLGEESQPVSGSDLLFVADPIDGTSMFAVGGPTWTVSVAVFRNNEPLAAAVYAPALDEFFLAANGVVELNGRPLVPVPFVEGKNSSVFVPSNYGRRYILMDFPGRIYNLSSGCLHLCYVAAGRADAAILRAHPWDVAPGFVLMPWLGGGVRDTFGREIQWSGLDPMSGQRTPLPLVFAVDPAALDYFTQRVVRNG